MRTPLLLSVFLTCQIALQAQDPDTARIASILPTDRILVPLEYLASDKMRGRYISNMDPDYTVNFIRAYILSAQYIANDPHQPCWTVGDPYEKDWLKLFNSSSTP